jgi:hypothetical protein
LIIRYFASVQKKQEHHCRQINIWAFRSSVPLSKKIKAAGVIPNNQKIFFMYIRKSALSQICY